MNAAGLVSLFRSQMEDQAQPYLWSDAEIYTYIDEAQDMFCRLVGGISDSTSAVTRITVRAGETYVPLANVILDILEAERSDGATLRLVTRERAAEDSAYQARATAGPIAALGLNFDAGSLRVLPVPEADDVISLSVSRLPLEEVTAGGNQDLEVDRQHHYSLLYWMKALAYQKEGAETFDRGRAEENVAAFRAYCSEASIERIQREYTPGIVAYGGL